MAARMCWDIEEAQLVGVGMAVSSKPGPSIVRSASSNPAPTQFSAGAAQVEKPSLA